VTDEGGRVFQHLEYFPFGETWVEEKSNTQRTPYLFTGKELDEDTGLYYFGARYYDQRTSVWASVDPILDKYLPTGNKEKDGKLPGMGGVFNSFNLGLYSYGDLNPIKFFDPDGNSDLPYNYKDLGNGHSAFIEKFNTNGEVGIEVTIFKEASKKNKRTELGVLNEKGWINKHGGKIPKLPPSVVKNLQKLKPAGKALGWLSLGITIFSVQSAYAADGKTPNSGYQNTTREVVSTATGWTGAVIGAGEGAKLGAAIGTCIEPGGGTVVGGVIGGFVGGIAGGMAGSKFGEVTVDKAYEKRVEVIRYWTEN
jgi:RHS repeat-associated protein